MDLDQELKAIGGLFPASVPVAVVSLLLSKLKFIFGCEAYSWHQCGPLAEAPECVLK